MTSHSDDPAAVACCDAAWYPSSDELALASNFLAYGNPGLSVVDAETGLITNLVAGLPAEGDSTRLTFSFFRAPYSWQATKAPTTPSSSSSTKRMTSATRCWATRSHRSHASSGDNDTTITPLRDDAVALEGEVAWLADGSGVAYLKDLKIEGEKPTGSIVWLPVNGEPVDLPVHGQSLHWIAPTITVPATAAATEEPTPMPQEDAESAELSTFAADLWGFKHGRAARRAARASKASSHSRCLLQSSALPLWASHTYGLRSFEPEQYQTVGIFTRQDGRMAGTLQAGTGQRGGRQQP